MSNNVYYIEDWHNSIIDQREQSFYDEIDFGNKDPKKFYYNINKEGDLLITYGNNSEAVIIKQWSQMPIATFTFGSGQNKVSYTVNSKKLIYDNGGSAKYISVTDYAKKEYVADNKKVLTNILDKLINIKSTNNEVILINAVNNKIIAEASDNIINIVSGTGNDLSAGVGKDMIVSTGGSGNILNGGGGNDSLVNIIGKSNILAGGDGNDFLRDFKGQSTIIQGGSGDDVITVSQGNNQILAGNEGSDTYKILSGINRDTIIIIDQNTAGLDDKDTLQLIKVAKEDVTFVLSGKDLQIKCTNGGLIVVQNWYTSPLSKIAFNNATLKLADIIDKAKAAALNNTEVTYIGTDVITLLKGNAMYKQELNDGSVRTSLLTNVTTGVQGGLQLNKVFGAYTEEGGDVTGNTLKLTNTVAQIAKGGYTLKGNANKNNVILNNAYINVGAHDDSSAACVIGGQTLNGLADNNTVIVSGGELNSINGGRGTIGSSGNSVTIQDDAIIEDLVQAGRSSGGTISNNTIEISSGYVRWIQAARGRTSVDSATNVLFNNKVIMTGGSAKSVIGADANYGYAKKNNVSISNSSNVDYVAGAKIRSGKGNAAENNVTITNTVVSDVVYGGYSNNGFANGNTVNIIDANINKIIGGYSINNNAYNNTITLKGKSVVKNIYGAIGGNMVYDNIINLEDNVSVENIYTATGFVATGKYNTVNVNGLAKVTGAIYGTDGIDKINVTGGEINNIFTYAGDDIIMLAGNSQIGHIDAGDGDDTITVDELIGTNVFGGAGDDIINIKGGNNNEVIGGTGSDTYNVTWALGNKLYIDTGDYLDGDKETININLDKSAFDFSFGNGSLILTDKKGGSIEIGLMEGLTTSANFDGISFNGQLMSAEQIQAIAKNNIEMHNPSLYSGSDGKDVFLMTVDNKNNKGFIYNIDNFGDEDAISATKLMTDAWGSVTYGGHTQSGNDLLVYINGVDKGQTTQIGTVRLKDYFLNASERKLNVCGETVNVNSAAYGDGISQLEVIQKLMSSLDKTTLNGYDAMDEAVNACSFGKYSSLKSLVNSFINDCTGHSGTKYSAAQTEFLKKYCGIDLDNEDTGAITGADAGGATVKNKDNIVEEKNFNLSDYIYNTNDYFTLTSNQVYAYKPIDANATIYGKTVDGVTFYWSEDNINNLVNYGYSEDNLKQIISGVVNVWADPAMKLVKESYNLSMDSEGSTWKRMSDGTVGIQLYLEATPNNGTLASVNSTSWYYTSKPNITTETNGALIINAAYFDNGFSDENGDSGYSSSGYLDRVLAHEIVHGVMAANINRDGKLPTFIKEGLAELVHGVDDNRKNEILDLSNINYSSTWTSSVSGSTTYNQREFLNALFDMNNPNTKFSRYTYGGGYMLLRYLAKQTVDYCTNTGINSYGADSLLSSYTSRYGAAANAMLGFSESSLTANAGANSFGAQLNDGSDRKMFVTGNK